MESQSNTVTLESCNLKIHGPFKRRTAFSQGEGICYISEHAFDDPWWEEHAQTDDIGDYWLESDVEAAGTAVTGAYTRDSLVELCEGRPMLASAVFDLCDWQDPSTVLEEFDEEDYAEVKQMEYDNRAGCLPNEHIYPVEIEWTFLKTVGILATSEEDALQSAEVLDLDGVILPDQSCRIEGEEPKISDMDYVDFKELYRYYSEESLKRPLP